MARLAACGALMKENENMVMSCDVVGGVQGLAEKWAEADDEIQAAQDNVSRAQNTLDAARSRKESTAKALAERVGRNVPMKAFHVGTDIVIVEHERGIRRVPIEVIDRR